MDGRWLVIGALAGLTAVSAGRGSAAKKPAKAAKGKSGEVVFPIPGISVNQIGPVHLVAYEKEQDLRKAAHLTINFIQRPAAFDSSSSFKILEPGEAISPTPPASVFGIYGPETQNVVWELTDFPGWLIFDLDAEKPMQTFTAREIDTFNKLSAKSKRTSEEQATWRGLDDRLSQVGSIACGPPVNDAPPRRANAGMRYMLMHARSGTVKTWDMEVDVLVMFILFREAAVPGSGKKEQLSRDDENAYEVLQKILGMPSNEEMKNITQSELDAYDKRSTRLTKTVIDVWKAEGEVLPPTKWHIKNYRAPKGTISIAYAIPGDPWALDWVWPDAPGAEAAGAVRKALHRSRVPVGRKSALTLEGLFDPDVGFQWKIRGAFEFFGRNEMNRITLDETGGFPDASSGWGATDEDKGLPLFQTSSGWKAAVGFGWTFMRLLALLHNGDRMDASGQKTRAALRKLLIGKGRTAWRAWYELALGDRKNEVRVVAQQHEVRPSAARQQRDDGFVSRPSSSRMSNMPLDVEIPAYEVELETLVDETSTMLGRTRQQTLLQQQAVTAPVAQQTVIRKKKKRGAIVDRVFALGPTGRIAATAVLYQGDPEWWLLGEDREAVRSLGTARPKPKDL